LPNRYIKDLVNTGMLDLAGEAFSITKTGHDTEVSLRLNLRKRIQTDQQATKNMYDDLTTNKKVMERDIVVPPSDREFLRGVISVKNIVRYFALSELIRTKEETIVGIKDKMLMRYGWNCSKPYFYHVIRDELGDQSEIPEKVKANMTSEINEELANCV